MKPNERPPTPSAPAGLLSAPGNAIAAVIRAAVTDPSARAGGKIDTGQLARAAGLTEPEATRALESLAVAGVASRTPTGWQWIPDPREAFDVDRFGRLRPAAGACHMV